MRWRLILEEYGPDLQYVKGQHNVVADALSRLDISETPTPTDLETLADCYGLDDDELPEDAFPLRYKHISRVQKQDKKLLSQVKKDRHYHLKTFCGGDKSRTLICRDEKIVIPQELQRRTVEWYHVLLCHPGENRTELTIRQHFWWKSLREDVKDICSKCPTCQKTKRSYKKYGLLPEKEAEADPWEKLCVDLIGPYTIKRKNKPTLTLWCVTMIDPATGWFEMVQIPNKRADTIANIVEVTWLTRYPWPSQIVFDKGSEFMAEFTKMVKKDYQIKIKGISTRNPQANAIIERVHQTLGNVIRTFQVHDAYLDEDDPWSGILAAAMFAIRATVHTTLQATPSQLVFGRDAIMNIKFEADWRLIRERKQSIIKQNNKRENARRIPHKYKTKDKVLYRTYNETSAKYGEDPYSGPHEIVKVNDNGTVRLKMGSVVDTVNIRLLKPYKE
jgi:Integrase zinc binding domain